MTSRITELKEIYGKFQEILPEELVDENLYSELENGITSLNNIIEEDSKFVKKLIHTTKSTINLKQFDNPNYLIKKSFLYKKEKLGTTNNEIKYLLGHWYMSKYVLELLTQDILNILPSVKQLFEDYQSGKTISDKRKSHIHLTRKYQEFFGIAVNISHLIDDYVDFFNLACKKIDPNYSFQGVTLHAHIYDYEMLEGFRELILRGNTGRATSFFLLRPAMETIVIRTVLNTEYSNKYKNKKIVRLDDVGFSDIVEAVRKLKLEISIGTDTMNLLYRSISEVLHTGIRPRHSEMWYVYHVVDNIRNGVIGVRDKEKNFDQLLDYLVDKGKIKIK